MPTHRPVLTPPPPRPGPAPGMSIQKPSDIRFDNLPAITPTVGLVLGAGVAAFFVAVFLLQTGESRAKGKTEKWARANGFEVIKTAVVKSDRGPFKKRPSWQTVTAVTVRTPRGMNRSAWICWGNFFFLYFGEPTVEWDDQAGLRAS